MIRTVRIDDKTFTHTQAEKLIKFLRDRHGFTLGFLTVPNAAPETCWVCRVEDLKKAELNRSGSSFWDCLSRAAMEVCKPIIEEERRGGSR